MRQLTSHKVNGLNETIEISVLDEPGQGNACHAYDVTGFDTESNPSSIDQDGYRRNFSRVPIVFQNGPVGDAGPNGISNESLLAIVIDRLQGFQSGEFRCRENAIALTHIEEATLWLQKRTRDRMARGVEGTNKI